MTIDTYIIILSIICAVEFFIIIILLATLREERLESEMVDGCIQDLIQENKQLKIELYGEENH